MNNKQQRYAFIGAIISFIMLPILAQAETIDVLTCDAADLITALNTANQNGQVDEVILNGDCTYTLTTADNQIDGNNGLPVISSEITINGNGATIQRTGDSKFRLLYITSTGVITLNHITLTHGLASENVFSTTSFGGGIYNNQGRLRLVETSLQHNIAHFYGGGIYNLNGSVVIDNSQIKHNQAKSQFNNLNSNAGGGIYSDGGLITVTNSALRYNETDDVGNGGGGIYGTRDTIMTLENSDVISNNAFDGAGIKSNGELYVYGTVISGNQALGDAGGIYAATYAKIVSSTISHNVANEDDNDSGSGGGFYLVNGSAWIDNSLISHNSGHCGGGVGTMATAEAMTITNSRINHNLAKNGGGVCALTIMTIQNSEITNNSAIDNGGGTYQFNNETQTRVNLLTIQDSWIAKNNAGRYGGGTINFLGTILAITDTSVLTNQAYDFGGGINNSGILRVFSSTIAGNSVINHEFVSRFGGGIHNNRNANLYHTKIVSNTADYGGGIWNDTMAVLNVDASEIIRNHAHSAGGGLGNFNQVQLNKSTIANNTTTGLAGGIYNEVDNLGGGVVVITNSTVSNNWAEDDAGGIYNSANLIIKNSTVVSNRTDANHENTSESRRWFVGGIVNYIGAGNHVGVTTIQNSIIANNQSATDHPDSPRPDLYGDVNSLGYNLIGNSTGGIGFVEDDLLNLDPILGPLQDNGGPTPTHALLLKSPAIDAGLCTNAVSTDQRGEPRPNTVSNQCDIGAYESALLPVADIMVSLAQQQISPAVGDTVVFTLTVANIGPNKGWEIAVQNKLPDGYHYLSHTPKEADYDANTGLWTVDSLNSGLQETLLLEATVTGSGNYTNVAQVSLLNATDPITTNNIATFAVMPRRPLLEVTKRGPAQQRAQQEVLYELFVHNNGTAPATNLVVTDTLPVGSTYIRGGIGVVDRVIQWSLQELRPGQTFTTTFEVSALDDLINFDYGVMADHQVRSSGLISVYTNIIVGSQGAFANNGQQLGQAQSQAAALADLDNDNDLDVFVANNGPNQIWLNNGFGLLSDNGQQLGNANSQSVALGDIDNDGDLDAVVANLGQNQIWLNDGQANFSLADQTIGAGDSQSIFMGDIDQDNQLDVMIGNDGANEVWLNDGTGIFTNTGQQLGNETTQAVVLGDVNGDGTLDSLVGNDGVNEVWLNDGTGIFTNTGQQLGNETTQAISIGDLNGDNLLDLTVGNDGPNQVWLNDGTGVFTNTGQILGEGNSQAIVIGDLDEDDDLDIVIGENGPNSVWLNDGTGIFTNTGQTLGTSNTNAVLLGDLDGDTDLDTFDGNSTNTGQANMVWLNLNQIIETIDSEGGQLDLSQGFTFTVDIPAQTLAESTTFTYTPLAMLNEAPPTNFTLLGRAFTLEALQNGTQLSQPFNQPVTLKLYYNPEGIDPQQVTLHYFDTVQNEWLDAATTCDPTSTYTRGTNFVQVDICHLTQFAPFMALNIGDTYLPIIQQ